MKDRKIDAFFWIGGLPTAAVTDLVATPNLKVKFIKTDQYVAEHGREVRPGLRRFTLPQGSTAGVEGGVPGIGIGNILFVNANMNEELVGDILKTIFDNLTEVQRDPPRGEEADAGDRRARLLDPVPPRRDQVLQGEGCLEGVDAQLPPNVTRRMARTMRYLSASPRLRRAAQRREGQPDHRGVRERVADALAHGPVARGRRRAGRGLSVYALYWTQYSITTQVYRATFLMLVLVLSFVLYPLRTRRSAVEFTGHAALGVAMFGLFWPR